MRSNSHAINILVVWDFTSTAYSLSLFVDAFHNVFHFGRFMTSGTLISGYPSHYSQFTVIVYSFMNLKALDKKQYL